MRGRHYLPTDDDELLESELEEETSLEQESLVAPHNRNITPVPNSSGRAKRLCTFLVLIILVVSGCTAYQSLSDSDADKDDGNGNNRFENFGDDDYYGTPKHNTNTNNGNSKNDTGEGKPHTDSPTISTTAIPTITSTKEPTANPTVKETSSPSASPTKKPTDPPISQTSEPSTTPSSTPSQSKSNTPDTTTTDNDKTQELIEKWGKWHFWDDAAETRPDNSYLLNYPNMDCPSDAFPTNAWQTDAVYVNHFLDSAAELIERAQEAIYTEYGWGPRSTLTTDQIIQRKKMFHLYISKDEDVDSLSAPPAESVDAGGWAPERSFQSLSRRLLHAMMTNDDFTVVLGGHSAAAGHGNHFQQSYMMQFHKVMEPIFARLGVKLITRNIARGGLGTLQDGLASGSIYGDKVDMILWDSGMTEPEGYAVDLFHRQALIGGDRPPVLVGYRSFPSFKALYRDLDADIMYIGSGMVGIPETEDEKQVESLPWAAQNLKCQKDVSYLCTDKKFKFRTTCWVARDDVKPPTQQASAAGSQVGWHPGFREHQLKGRVIAMVVLEALLDAVNTWLDAVVMDGPPLSDQYWHVTDYYLNIQSKARDESKVGSCKELSKFMNPLVCTTPLNGRSEFTPRADPDKTSIISLLKPAGKDKYIPSITEKLLYEGPDVTNPSLQVPDGEVDVLAIVSNRRRQLLDSDLSTVISNNQSETVQHGGNYMEADDESKVFDLEKDPNSLSIATQSLSHPHTNSALRRRTTGTIVPGLGWEHAHNAFAGQCDGTYSAICDRKPSSNCLLYGHHDVRSGIVGGSLSGWLVMNIPNVKKGFIMIKMETFHRDDENPITKGWTEENNGQEEEPQDRHRQLDDSGYVYPPGMMFDFAIDGVVTTWNAKEFKDVHRKRAQRVCELFTLLDDRNFEKKNGESTEVAIRIRGCPNHSYQWCTFILTHVYWA